MYYIHDGRRTDRFEVFEKDSGVPTICCSVGVARGRKSVQLEENAMPIDLVRAGQEVN